jgi:predicted transcriptional regulator
MRARLIHSLRVQPGNMNQLATRLDVEYRTIKHHIDVLTKNGLIDSAGEHYGLTYFLNPRMEAQIEIFDDLCRKLGFEFE